MAILKPGADAIVRLENRITPLDDILKELRQVHWKISSCMYCALLEDVHAGSMIQSISKPSPFYP
ncbi:hypothetical protein PsorP6_002207 [Peronosclerospora sorghi]|uniref:Uncharacterized protein n=1 Tax=Peronosclerospora sorghi TaxID=230839 RepID=A0ACC0WTZ7_9STRA|nr:hypothetical protein PsorP6_002207 [Peronosclerospora sorghi]